MTLTVILIALLHAVPVLVVGAVKRSKIWLAVTAMIAGVIGVVTGSPAYAAVDLLAVAVAFFVGISYINSQKAVVPKAPKLPPTMPEEKKEGASWTGSVVTLIVVAAFLANKTTDKPTALLAPSPSTPIAPAPQQVVLAASPPADTHPQIKSRSASRGIAHTKPGNSDLRHCLNLRSNAAIAKCVDRGA